MPVGKRDGNHSLGGMNTRDKEEEGSRGRSADHSFQELCLGGRREMGQWRNSVSHRSVTEAGLAADLCCSLYLDSQFPQT